MLNHTSHGEEDECVDDESMREAVILAEEICDTVRSHIVYGDEGELLVAINAIAKAAAMVIYYGTPNRGGAFASYCQCIAELIDNLKRADTGEIGVGPLAIKKLFDDAHESGSFGRKGC